MRYEMSEAAKNFSAAGLCVFFLCDRRAKSSHFWCFMGFSFLGFTQRAQRSRSGRGEKTY